MPHLFITRILHTLLASHWLAIIHATGSLPPDGILATDVLCILLICMLEPWNISCENKQMWVRNCTYSTKTHFPQSPTNDHPQMDWAGRNGRGGGDFEYFPTLNTCVMTEIEPWCKVFSWSTATYQRCALYHHTATRKVHTVDLCSLIHGLWWLMWPAHL
jgi:hypothetical protein